jgi:hypothetical protein
MELLIMYFFFRSLLTSFLLGSNIVFSSVLLSNILNYCSSGKGSPKSHNYVKHIFDLQVLRKEKVKSSDCIAIGDHTYTYTEVHTYIHSLHKHI